MTTFTTGGSAATFTTSGTTVSFDVVPTASAFTAGGVYTPAAHASSHGAGGSDPITTLGTVAFNAGAAATPTIAFTGDPNTGIYSPGADQVALVTHGTAVLSVDSVGLISGTGASLGAWTSYTPSIGGSGSAKGDGSTNGYYVKVGKMVHWRAEFILGSTSTVGGDLTISLPVTADSTNDAYVGFARGIDQGVANYALQILYATTVVYLYTATWGGVSTASPFAWSTSDSILVSGTYEEA